MRELFNPEAFSVALPLGAVFGVFILLISSMVLAFFGKKIPRRGDWLAAVGIVASSGAFAWDRFSVDVVKWSRKWVDTGLQDTVLNVGFFSDWVGFGTVSVLFLIGLIFIFNDELTFAEKRPERFSSGLCLALAGASLCWLSVPPWIGFMGLGLGIGGAVLALSGQADSDADSEFLIRWSGERFSFLAVSVLGVCAWQSAAGNSVLISIGAVLFLMGLFFQTEGFPILGSSILSPKLIPLKRGLFTQVLPLVSVFGILFRSEDVLRATGVLTEYSVFLLISFFVSALVAFFSKRDWMVRGLSFAAASALVHLSYCLSGGAVATLSLWTVVAWNLSTALLASWEATHETEKAPGRVNASTAVTTGTLVAAWIGILASGLVPLFGAIEFWGEGSFWLFVVLYSLAEMLFVASVWKAFQNIKKGMLSLGRPLYLKHFTTFSPFLVLFVIFVLQMLFFSSEPKLLSLKIPSEQVWTLALALHGGMILIGGVLAIFLSRNSPVSNILRWDVLLQKLPRFAALADRGLGSEFISQGLSKAAKFTGQASFTAADGFFWKKGISEGGAKVRVQAGGVASKIGQTLESGIDTLSRLLVETPGKVLQVVQNGDLQWYIVFAVGSGMALLLHFLRSS